MTSRQVERKIFDFAYHCMGNCDLEDITIVKHTYPWADDYDMTTYPEKEGLADDLRLLFESLCLYMGVKGLVRLNISYEHDRVNVSYTQAHYSAAAMPPVCCLSGTGFNQLIG